MMRSHHGPYAAKIAERDSAPFKPNFTGLFCNAGACRAFDYKPDGKVETPFCLRFKIFLGFGRGSVGHNRSRHATWRCRECLDSYPEPDGTILENKTQDEEEIDNGGGFIE